MHLIDDNSDTTTVIIKTLGLVCGWKILALLHFLCVCLSRLEKWESAKMCGWARGVEDF
jgi:hypothetical protein